MYTQSSRFSLWHIYLLYFFLGVFGAHHLALKRPRIAFLYLLTFGLLGMGMILDFFIIPFYHRNYIKRLNHADEENKDKKESKYVSKKTSINHSSYIDQSQVDQSQVSMKNSMIQATDWKRIPLLLKPFYWAYVWLLLCFIPLFFLVFFGDFSFSILFALLIITVSFPATLYRFAKAPILGHFVLGFFNGLNDLQNFYKSGRASSIITKTLVGPFGFCFSSVRQEVKLFKGLIQFSVVYIIYEWVSLIIEYFKFYYPHLSPIDMLASVKLPVLLVQFIVLSWFALPLTHGLVRLKDHSHKKFKYTFLCTALLVSVILLSVNGQINLVYEDFERLKTRFKHQDSFAKQVHQTTIASLQRSSTLILPSSSTEEFQGHSKGHTITSEIIDILSSLGLRLYPSLSPPIYDHLYNNLQPLFPISSPEINALHVLVFQRDEVRPVKYDKIYPKMRKTYTYISWQYSLENAKIIPKRKGIFALIFFGFTEKHMEQLSIFEWKDNAWHIMRVHEDIIYQREVYLLNKLYSKQ
jgi:TM2 domain-containing membrane protein YozV